MSGGDKADLFNTADTYLVLHSTNYIRGATLDGDLPLLAHSVGLRQSFTPQTLQRPLREIGALEVLVIKPSLRYFYVGM